MESTAPKHATLFFAISFLLALSSPSLASPTCNTDTNASISKCILDANTRIEACRPGQKFVQKKAECLCNAYTQLADCWAGEEGCRNDWRGLKAEATKMCSLSRKKTASSKSYRSVMNDFGSAVTTLITSGDLTPSSSSSSVHAMENRQQQHLLRFTHITRSNSNTNSKSSSPNSASNSKKRKRSLGVQDPHTPFSTYLATQTQSQETIFEFLDLELGDVDGDGGSGRRRDGL